MKKIHTKKAMQSLVHIEEIKEYLKWEYNPHRKSDLEMLEAEKTMLRDALSILDEKLQVVQNRCTARTVTPYDVIRALRRIEKKLDMQKKDMEGIVADIDYHAQDFSNAYKYTPESTQIIAIYHNREWLITEIKRATTRRESQRILLTLTDEAKKHIIDQYQHFS